MTRIIKRALLNALGTTVYILSIVSFVFYLQKFSSKPDTILIPIAMLMLFVCSVAITGFLVFGKPVMLYIDGKKKDAVYLLGHTIVILLVLTVLAFIALISYYN